MINASDKSDLMKYAVIGAAVIGVLFYVKKKATVVATETVKAVNPVNRSNVFYRGVNAVGDVFDDGATDESFSLGSWIYDVMNPGAPFNNTKPPASR